MGSENRHLKKRIKREESLRKIREEKPDNWLIVCEGQETEKNYISSLIDNFNLQLNNHKINYKIKGYGQSNKKLVLTAEQVSSFLDSCNLRVMPYNKVFVVYDKDSFKNDDFDNSIKMCEARGYISLWSNESFELWLLLYFNHYQGNISRVELIKKINKEFKNLGLKIKYSKTNDKIFELFDKYGSIDKAYSLAKKNLCFYSNFETPSKCFSCTTMYKLLDELENYKSDYFENEI